MARDHGRINWSIWSDSDWKQLKVADQWAFEMLLTQPGLSFAGVVPYTLRRWSTLAEDLTIAKLRKALSTLEAARYVVIDEDTEELLIRSFIRNDGILSSPNIVRSMTKDFDAVCSPLLRAVIVCEVFRLQSEGSPGSPKSWDEVLTPWLAETLPGTFGEGFPGTFTQTQLLTLETVEKGTLDETISLARAAPALAIAPAPRRGGLPSAKGSCEIHRLAEPCNGCAADRKARS